jgi:hypothetical protein
MGRTRQKFLIRLAISASVAIASPAIAAGLVAGTSAAASAGAEGLGNTIYPADVSAGSSSDSSPAMATHGPAKLSVLAGTDDAAWASAHSVHVDFAKRKPN